MGNVNSILARFDADLSQRMRSGMHRTRRAITSVQGPIVIIAGKELLNFSSNDYLGLAAHPELLDTLKRAVDVHGVGAGASQLVCGHSVVHAELEEALAKFTGRQRALVFSSGYLANLAVASSMVNRESIIIEDRLDHASLIDAARLSQARLNRYRHADIEDAERILKKHHLKTKLVLTDGVFSMDGDIAPLKPLTSLCRKYDAMLMVDDAHGFGVLGKKGGGVLEHLGLDSNEVPILMGTFGKSLGVMGAFVAGDETLIEVLIQKARSYIYTTALPPAVAVTVTRALGLVEHEGWRRDHLNNLINQFRRGCQQLGLKISPSETAIQPLVIGDPREAIQVSERLYKKGILIPAIRPPTVPPGTSRLRISLSAAHEGSQINYLLESLDAVL